MNHPRVHETPGRFKVTKYTWNGGCQMVCVGGGLATSKGTDCDDDEIEPRT